jgi:hypothetical protein
MSQRTELEEEFNRHYRPRKMPQRLEENPNSAALISFHTFYRKAVIDSLLLNTTTT